LQNLGDTDICFSPNVIAANAVTFFTNQEYANFIVKICCEDRKHMGNIDSKGFKLDSYAVNDFVVSYEIQERNQF
jgi:iron complex outermembrane receptor protein